MKSKFFGGKIKINSFVRRPFLQSNNSYFLKFKFDVVKVLHRNVTSN